MIEKIYWNLNYDGLTYKVTGSLTPHNNMLCNYKIEIYNLPLMGWRWLRSAEPTFLRPHLLAVSSADCSAAARLVLPVAFEQHVALTLIDTPVMKYKMCYLKFQTIIIKWIKNSFLFGLEFRFLMCPKLAVWQPIVWPIAKSLL